MNNFNDGQALSLLGCVLKWKGCDVTKLPSEILVSYTVDREIFVVKNFFVDDPF